MRSDIRHPEQQEPSYPSPRPSAPNKRELSENLLAEAHTENYVRGMQQLVAVVQRLSLARNLESITALVRHAARELTQADGATFVLRDSNLCYYVDEDAIFAWLDAQA